MDYPLSTRLIWRKGLPNKVGYYWFRNVRHRDEKEPQIYHVRDYAGQLAIGNSRLQGWTRMEEGEWAGPIEMPLEGERNAD